MSENIKVLIVEDSALQRKIISDIISKAPGIEVIGSANNGKTAIFKNDKLNPDVITMDIEMPIMDGLESLRHIIQNNPKPVIMMSVLTQHGTETTFKALEYGAVDFIPKPSSQMQLSLEDIADLLIEKIRTAYNSNILASSKKKPDIIIEEKEKQSKVEKAIITAEKKSSKKIVGIGTSTGGPSALMEVFRNFPKDFPSPILVVQHMPEGFTKAFSARLNSNSEINVKEAENGDHIMPGCGYIAPGHSHMEILSNGNGKRTIKLFQGDKVSGHRPSIDVLFNSIAEKYTDESVCVIMTGMGQDGAEGILNVKNNGGYTLAQNEETSVVYGMNRVAVNLGAINEVIDLHDIPQKIVEHL